MKPLLPRAEKLLPYLEKIDASRIYCNFGPLNEEYSERLGKLFGRVVTCSSATTGLIACLMALELPKGSFIACPSWTFIATPAAIVAAGHVPYFVDVENGRVTDDILNKVNVSAAIVVSPCGAPIKIKGNVPIIIDAAGGFDTFSTLCKPEHPTVISTHATKVFGTGEGGFVCADHKFLEKVQRIINFGRNGAIAESLGINGKFSEYHAAIGLAELDGWDDKRDRYLRKTKIYELNYATSLVATRGEGKKGVYGCHNQPAYKNYPRTDLSITNDLIKKTSFIPVSL